MPQQVSSLSHLSSKMFKCFFSTAFLPSSFAMYAVTLAFAFAVPPSSMADNRRTLAATSSFAIGGIVGWPFALALSLPFVLEELFLFSGDRVLPEQKASWMFARWRRLLISGILAGLILVRSSFVIARIHRTYFRSFQSSASILSHMGSYLSYHGTSCDITCLVGRTVGQIYMGPPLGISISQI